MKKKVNGFPNAIQDRIEQRRNNKTAKSPKAKKKPPAAKPVPGRAVAWESKSHRLEINPPVIQASRVVPVDDLSTSDDDEGNRYKKSIDKLLNDVSINGQEYVKAKTSEQLNASRRLLADQEHEIKTYREDLDATSRNCDTLRRSLDVLNKEVVITKTEAEILENEKENLEKKLFEFEIEGRQSSKELNELRESCRRLTLDKRLTAADIETLTNQRELLLTKLEEFELKNRKLRKMLKEARKVQESELLSADRCEILLQKLTAAEMKLQSQSAQLVDQDKQIDALIAQVDADKQQAKSYDELHKTMEATRAHLQNQLRLKEAEGNRLDAQLRRFEDVNNATTLKADHYQGLLAATRDKAARDKEALKKATRIQRERAQKQEELNGELQGQISNLLVEVEKMKVSSKQMTEENSKLQQGSDSVDDEVKCLRRYILDLSSVVELPSKYANAKPTQIIEKVVAEVKKLKNANVDSENGKEKMQATEEKLISLEKNMTEKLQKKENALSEMRSALNEYEGLTSEYKEQVDRFRQEKEHLNEKIASQEQELRKQLHASVLELNEVKSSLQTKVAELEPYPEQLKVTEIRLKDAQERADNAERHSSEHKILVSELTQKLELLTEKVDHLQEKYRNKVNENKLLDQQRQIVERKLDEDNAAHRELVLSMSRKEEIIITLQSKFEDQQMQNERLVEQLEIALSNAKKEAESQKEKAFAKERSAQARIMDLESKLSRSTQNTQILRQSKEDAERKFGSRLQDMRDRLEQANSTTRSLQNYVNFLKSTYANVFSEDVGSDHRI